MENINHLVKKYGSLFQPALDNRIKEINAEIVSKTEALTKERDELIQVLNELNKRPTSFYNQPKIKLDTSDEIGYSPSMSIINKANYVVKKNGWLTLNEISTKIQEIELGIDVASLNNGLSAVLAMDAKRENRKFDRKRNEKNKWIYNLRK